MRCPKPCATLDSTILMAIFEDMATAHNHPPARSYDIAAWLLTGGALLLVLLLHLLPAFVAGLFVHELVHVLAPRLKMVRIRQEQGKLAAVAILALGVVLLLTLAVMGIIAFFRSEAGSLPTLLHQMADILERWRTVLPASVVAYLPQDVEALRATTVAWLRTHAGALPHAGAAVGRTLAHILIGLGIGALVALYDAQPPETFGPLAHALQERASRLGEAFRRVVFAQVRISAVNAILTALYLIVALPLVGVYLPLAKTMLAVTFVVGLLPVVGNLLSNTVIVILSLSISLAVAIASLVFLVVIHKLEYFLNAHLVGTQVQAHAWELLLAMLVMEAAFGIPGLIAAPIYYAYLKSELVSRKLV
jgi:predicted PurR-regulated permease PerM